MTAGKWRCHRSIILSVAALALLPGCVPSRVADIDADGFGSTCGAGSHALTRTFDAGSQWSLCWADEPMVGLTLSSAEFTAPDADRHTVLAEAALAQIHVPYDDGEHGQLDMPAFGSHTADLRPSDCPGGEIESNGRPLLCATLIQDNLRFAWSDDSFDSGNHSQPGQCLDLFTMTPVDWYTYVNRWTLCDDGSMRPSVGAGGRLAPSFLGDDTNSVPLGEGDNDKRLGHFHNVFWRVQFDLGSPTSLRLDDISYSMQGSKVTTTASPIRVETATRSGPRHSWRVTSEKVLNSDAHAVGYDIDLQNRDSYQSVPGAEYAENDLIVTQNHPCELLAAGNTMPHCGRSLIDYVSEEQLTEPILWLQSSFHHLPRDEDQPLMNEHWQGLSFTPRGLSAENPLTSEGH